MSKMKLDFTKREAEVLLQTMRSENDMARLVDPQNQRVLNPMPGENGDAVCSKVWGICDRCENCTSLRALQNRSKAYKMELCDGKVYWVVSRYLSVDGSPCIMELINNVTNNLVMDSNQQDEVSELIYHYNHLLITDPLTGLYNRRFLDEYFLPSLNCCRDEQTVVNLAMLDLDNFKQVNDAYGHQAGDVLLKDVSGYWKRCFDSRKKGKERLVLRYGGDEILIIANGITKENFQSQLEEYYLQMRKVCYSTPKVQIPFSLTFGIASSSEFEPPISWEKLFNLADQRMYRAKSQKKNF